MKTSARPCATCVVAVIKDTTPVRATPASAAPPVRAGSGAGALLVLAVCAAQPRVCLA